MYGHKWVQLSASEEQTSSACSMYGHKWVQLSASKERTSSTFKQPP